ncbi:MAG: hypothetical protein OXQ90_00450 [Gammaproteobacteria bacterium]|nr:hypothetical protein [Gammaproteobacteria bacterium]
MEFDHEDGRWIIPDDTEFSGASPEDPLGCVKHDNELPCEECIQEIALDHDDRTVA